MLPLLLLPPPLLPLMLALLLLLLLLPLLLLPPLLLPWLPAPWLLRSASKEQISLAIRRWMVERLRGPPPFSKLMSTAQVCECTAAGMCRAARKGCACSAEAEGGREGDEGGQR